MNMVTISEIIFTVHFYKKKSVYNHVVTLSNMSLLNELGRLDYGAVRSES